MIPLLLAVLFCPDPATRPAQTFATAVVIPVADDKPFKALDGWMKLYRATKIEFLSKQNIVKDSFAMKFGLVPKGGVGEISWEKDLEIILDAVAKIDTAEAAVALLGVAAIGFDAGPYEVGMSPGSVRTAGEKAILKLSSSAAKDEVAKAARGELKVDKAMAVAVQAAATRCIGLLADRTARPALEALLADKNELVRAHAAEALEALGDEAAATALVNSLERETSDPVLMSVAHALRMLFAKYVTGSAPAADAPKDAAAPKTAELPESIRLAVRAGIKALGRTTWRADMEVVRLLDAFRSLETVPALIGMLERFHAHPEEVKSGKLSGLLQFQIHELLVSMTGAVIPANQPDKWRELWEREKDSIQVTQKHEPKGGPATTVASSFCGIPVQGTRVVFLLDLSGSMEWRCAKDQTKDGMTGLDYAQQELRRAASALAPNAQFTLVAFNGDQKAEVWSKEMVAATEKNRDRFLKHVDGLKARGGTNLWGGLLEALKIKSLSAGSRYESNVDELFVLSDGAPSVGEVIDPIEILRLVKESNKFANVRINTAFLNTVQPPNQTFAPMDHMTITASELMKRMAEQNGGTFKEL